MKISSLGVRTLLEWYRKSRRDFPWRRTRAPYRIWISEVMLQQTQVSTVVPYFVRFTRRFPDVRSLARASVQSVLKAWQGLGYYARARNLREAARRIVGAGGPFPTSAAGWRRLPGIGEYTAAAIASIAQGEPVAVFDGNVRRVAARLTGGEAGLREFVRASLHRRSPGDYNQALMELGQRICRPVFPACPECPLRGECRWFRTGRRKPLPAPRHGADKPHREIGIGVIRRAGKILVGRRPESSMLGGLWEFPGGKRRRGERIERTVEREVFEETGVRVSVGDLLTTVRHSYSHFDVTLRVFECRAISGRARPIGCDEIRWVRPAALARLPFPAANVRIIEAIRRPK